MGDGFGGVENALNLQSLTICISLRFPAGLTNILAKRLVNNKMNPSIAMFTICTN